MTTLKDIAKATGLSPATVSRALNGFPEVGERTRARVREVAERLDYRPNALARKLVSGRSDLIGVVLRSGSGRIADATFHETITGLAAHFEPHDIDLVFQVSPDGDDIAPYRRLVGKKTVDGFILNAPVPEDERVAWLRQADVPFVVHGRTDTGPCNYAYFDVDNFRAGHDALSLLLDLGHRRVLFLNGPESLSFAAERLRGFRTAHAERGLEPDDDLVFHGPQDTSFGYVSTLSALARDPHRAPTAVVCAYTLTAAGALRAIADRGLACPGDVSVIAHDDAVPHLRAIDLEPALTVTHAPLRDACGPLASHVLRLLAGESPETLQVTQAAELVVRRSTSAPPHGGSPPHGETPRERPSRKRAARAKSPEDDRASPDEPPPDGEKR